MQDTKPQIQEAQRTPKNKTLEMSYTNFGKSKIKKKYILKEAKEENTLKVSLLFRNNVKNYI